MKKLIALSMLSSVYFSASAKKVELTNIRTAITILFEEKAKLPKETFVGCCNELKQAGEIELKQACKDAAELEQEKIDLFSAQMRQLIQEKSNSNPIEKSALKEQIKQLLDQAEEKLNVDSGYYVYEPSDC